MIDTLKLSKGLQKAGMTEAEAEGITEALREAQSDYVTKQDLEGTATALKKDLEAAVSRLEARISDKASQIVFWILGSVVLQIVGHFWK
jgi:hypothetical protein